MNTTTAALAADRRAEEDAAWASRARLAAREQIAQQITNLDDATLDMLRESAHADRSNLVNLYIESDRKERIAETDLIIGVIEEEQAKRAGFASSDDLISALGGFEFVEVQDADHLATLLDVDEDEKAPAEKHYAVECQDEDTHGVHSARFLYVNQYGQTVYTVVCAGFEERYTSEVVYEVPTPVNDSATN